MILYFLRHGLAEERTTWTQDDDLRPLTDKGVKQMKRSADTISDLIQDVDAIITSPLVRARQTAEIIAERMGMQDSLEEDDRLSPGFGLSQLSEIIKEYHDAEALILVGHEPDFSRTISALIGGGNIVVKKGGLVRIDLEKIDPPQGWLVWIIPPRALVR